MRQDCYPTPHCLNSVLEDYRAAGGICGGSWLHLNFPGAFTFSNIPCEFHEPDDFYWFTDIKQGLCSEQTKQLIRNYEECGRILLNDKFAISKTSNDLIYSMCDFETYRAFIKPPADSLRVKQRNYGGGLEKKKRKINHGKVKSKSRKKKRRNKQTRRQGDGGDRLTPIEDIQVVMFQGFNVTYSSVPPLEHTRHRYPWLCSLRSVQNPSHLCAVTLLSRPPGPTVLVTSAHCTFLCKSEEGDILPNCCCPNVGPGSCDTNSGIMCGTDPQIVEMTGEEAEVICGEWDTDSDLREEYNVILPILNITIHPDFEISRGELNSQFVGNDIAVIHVRDDGFEEQSEMNKIYPACLPGQTVTNPESAVHSGWSNPPPEEYVASTAFPHLLVYNLFSKQWHYSMDITTCQDPQTDFWSGAPLQYPTDSYYPPGTVCATEKQREFCPTSGESGSPLMVTDGGGRVVAEGIHSFIKERF